MDVHGSPRRAALCSAAGGSHRALFVPPRVKKASVTLATTNMSTAAMAGRGRYGAKGGAGRQ